MNHPRLIALCVAVAALAGCNKEEHNLVGGDTPDTQAGELANASPVSLPPMIVSSHTFRCKDNSVVYVEFMNNNTANLRTTKEGPATVLTAPEAGKPFAAEGYSLTGRAGAKAVTLARPGKGSQECKA